MLPRLYGRLVLNYAVECLICPSIRSPAPLIYDPSIEDQSRRS